MTKYLIRKLGSSGDTCIAVTGHDELAGQLEPDLSDGYSAAVRVGDTTQLVGSHLADVMAAVETTEADGASQVELLLVPRVAGG